MSLLTVTELGKNFGKIKAVQNVSFSLPSGKCIAMIGPNGAGKTTILRMLSGLLKPTKGTIYFQGINKKDIRQYIGYLPQQPHFYPWMTGKEFLKFSGKLARLPKEQLEERTEELLHRVGIYDARNRRLQGYSGGMKQRLGIAQAIIHQPKLLILDEPVSALDPIGRREVLTLMEELKQKMTILFSTHILTDAEEISDELLLLHQGKLVESGSLTHLREKYQTATLELDFEHSIKQFQNQLERLEEIISTTIRRDVLYLTVKDIAKARKKILHLAAKEKWPLLNFTVNRASLEEMFMKVVD